MVNIVDDWKEMEAYAFNASRATARAYQVTQIETQEKTKKILLRVQIGKFGFEKEFSDLNDPILTNIISYCVIRRFLNVSKTIPDDEFFK